LDVLLAATVTFSRLFYYRKWSRPDTALVENSRKFQIQKKKAGVLCTATFERYKEL
jgi:hypothetical protein